MNYKIIAISYALCGAAVLERDGVEVCFGRVRVLIVRLGVRERSSRTKDASRAVVIFFFFSFRATFAAPLGKVNGAV